jgi:hypothetical protein
MEKLVGAGGLTSDREAGHPRLQVCPVDTSLGLIAGFIFLMYSNPWTSIFMLLLFILHQF